MEPFSRLVVRRTMEAEPDRLAAVLNGRGPWPGPQVAIGPDGLRRHEADLRLRVSDHPDLVTFGKAAFVDLGAVRPRGDGWEVEIGWRAASLAPLFPVFSGAIELEARRATLRGLYAPPGGVVGRLADRALLHVAATATARWLLDSLDRAALGAAAETEIG